MNLNRLRYIMFIISLTPFFILKLMFSSNKSITGTLVTLRNKYGGQTVTISQKWKHYGVRGTRHSAILNFEYLLQL